MPGRSKIRQVRRVYEFIKDHRDEYDVATMCRVLDIARAGYYAWLREPLSNRAKEDARLLRLIRASYKASHGVYGARRIFLDLREAGETCSKHRVERLMRQNGIKALHGYRTRYQAASKPSATMPDLVKRDFDVIRPNKVWVTDITYIRTWEGWLYLAVVMDLFSRKIIGWAVAPTLHRELVLNAVNQSGALAARKADSDSFRPGISVRQRRLAPVLPAKSPRTQHEQARQLLGQRGRRIFFCQPKEGSDQETHLRKSHVSD